MVRRVRVDGQASVTARRPLAFPARPSITLRPLRPTADSRLDPQEPGPRRAHKLSLIAPLLVVMHHLNRQPAYSDATIARVAAHGERVQRLRTVPSRARDRAPSYRSSIRGGSAALAESCDTVKLFRLLRAAASS